MLAKTPEWFFYVYMLANFAVFVLFLIFVGWVIYRYFDKKIKKLDKPKE